MTPGNFVIYGPKGRRFEFSKPAVMAILNATPDSFSDGGDIALPDSLVSRIKQVIDEGADIIDVGGESTRPGFGNVQAPQEIDRVVPVISAIRKINKDIPISIDTRKAEVARAALAAGADFVNDVSGVADDKMPGVIGDHGCSIVLMRHEPLGNDLAKTCDEQMRGLIELAGAQGIETNQIILDPGLGFGDFESGDFGALPGGNVAANLELIYHIEQYNNSLPVLIGASRKRFVGQLSGEVNAKDRLAGSIAVAWLALSRGASIIRAHDISQTVQVRDIVVSSK